MPNKYENRFGDTDKESCSSRAAKTLTGIQKARNWERRRPVLLQRTTDKQDKPLTSGLYLGSYNDYLPGHHKSFG